MGHLSYGDKDGVMAVYRFSALSGSDEIFGHGMDEQVAPLTGMDDTLYGRDGDDGLHGSVGHCSPKRSSTP
jgi:hypothetical protein